MDSLFKPGLKLNPEHKSKYIYLLAYAASVFEANKKVLNKEELKMTMQAVEKVFWVYHSSGRKFEIVVALKIILMCNLNIVILKTCFS